MVGDLLIDIGVGGAFGGDRLRITEALRVRGGETFSATVSYTRSDFSLPQGDFVTNLARVRASYSFSAQVFAQALLQYNDRADVWSSNFRFGWLQQANTGLFIVYTDSHPFDQIEPGFGTSRSFGPDRSLAVKFSRMFDVLD